MILGVIQPASWQNLGGINGRALKADDILVTKGGGEIAERKISFAEKEERQTIKIVKGPEWRMLKDLPDRLTFRIASSSNRMGIRLEGDIIEIEGEEIVSSAVIPGTIQLPSNGHPIVLMNDCQTTGGYPRIGKVVDEDLGTLAQIQAGQELKLEIVTFEEL